MEFSDIDPDAFSSKERMADYFVGYAENIAAPIRCGVAVNEVQRNIGRPGFRVETSDGAMESDRVEVATEPFERLPQSGPVVRRGCLWSARGLSGYRWPMNSSVPESTFTSRSTRTTFLPGAIAGVTSSRGCGFRHVGCRGLGACHDPGEWGPSRLIFRTISHKEP